MMRISEPDSIAYVGLLIRHRPIPLTHRHFLSDRYPVKRLLNRNQPVRNVRQSVYLNTINLLSNLKRVQKFPTCTRSYIGLDLVMLSAPCMHAPWHPLSQHTQSSFFHFQSNKLREVRRNNRLVIKTAMKIANLLSYTAEQEQYAVFDTLNY